MAGRTRLRSNPLHGRLLRYPAGTYWRELVEHYLEAKLILTVLDVDGQFDSVNKTAEHDRLLRAAAPYPRVNTAEEWATDMTFKDEQSVAGPEMAEERGRTFIAIMRERAFGGSA